MGKRKVITLYGLLFITMISFIIFQVAQTQHFIGYMSLAPVEEEVVTSAFSEMVIRFDGDLILGEGVGRNIGLVVSYTGQAPLLSCRVLSPPSSEVVISSSQTFSLHTGEEVVVPVSIQTNRVLSSSRNLSFSLDCEGYSQKFVFPFTLIDDSLSPSITGLAVQDETKTKLSFLGFVVVGIIAIVFIARLFHRRDTRNYDFQSYSTSRRKYIPLDIS